MRLISLTPRPAIISVPSSVGRNGQQIERLFVNVTVEILAPCKKLMRVEVEPAKVEETFAEITRDYQREARFPGFRPGKAPKDMVAKRFESEIQDEVKRKLISDSYRQAVAEQKITPVVAPDIEEVQFTRGQPLHFVATMETAPEFALPEYKGLRAQREVGGTTPADIERALQLFRERQKTFLTVDRAVKRGDVAVVSYTGSCEGKPITETAPTAKGLTENKSFWIETEKDSFLPGFSGQLLGAKAGEKRTVTIDFPANFMLPALAGKKGVYEVELVEVKEKLLPELDQKFAESWGAKDLAALREGVRADLQNEWNQTQNRKIRQQVTQALLQSVECDLPEVVVTGETRNLVYNIVSDNQQRGVSKEALDAEKDNIYATANNAARERVKAMFVFQKIAEAEGIRVEQRDILGRLQTLAAEHKMPVEKLFQELEKNHRLEEVVHRPILHDKVVDLLVQYAKIEDVLAPAKV
jgi:trigger factor